MCVYSCTIGASPTCGQTPAAKRIKGENNTENTHTRGCTGSDEDCFYTVRAFLSPLCASHQAGKMTGFKLNCFLLFTFYFLGAVVLMPVYRLFYHTRVQHVRAKNTKNIYMFAGLEWMEGGENLECFRFVLLK